MAKLVCALAWGVQPRSFQGTFDQGTDGHRSDETLQRRFGAQKQGAARAFWAAVREVIDERLAHLLGQGQPENRLDRVWERLTAAPGQKGTSIFGSALVVVTLAVAGALDRAGRSALGDLAIDQAGARLRGLAGDGSTARDALRIGAPRRPRGRA